MRIVGVAGDRWSVPTGSNRSRRTALVVALALAFGVGACGQSADRSDEPDQVDQSGGSPSELVVDDESTTSLSATEEASTSTPDQVDAPADSVAVDSATSTPEQVDSAGADVLGAGETQLGEVLGQVDPPPTAVAAQLTVFTAGDNPSARCAQSLAPGPAVVVESGSPEELVSAPGVGLCFPGFDESQPIDVAILRPAGEVTSELLPPLVDRQAGNDASEKHGANFLSFRIFPTDELGVYEISARQGDLVASKRFEVVLPDRVVAMTRPSYGPSGTDFTIGLAGLEPSTEAVLHLYFADPDDPDVTPIWFDSDEAWYAGPFDYVTSLVVTIDADGRGEYLIETSPGDPDGGYGLILEAEGYVSSFPPSDGQIPPWGWDGEFIIRQDKPAETPTTVAAADDVEAAAGCDSFTTNETPPVKLCDTGDLVVEIQTALAALGYPIEVDGYFGSGTEAAVKELQRASGYLEVDGYVGPLTLEYLFGP